MISQPVLNVQLRCLLGVWFECGLAKCSRKDGFGTCKISPRKSVFLELMIVRTRITPRQITSWRYVACASRWRFFRQRWMTRHIYPRPRLIQNYCFTRSVRMFDVIFMHANHNGFSDERYHEYRAIYAWTSFVEAAVYQLTRSRDYTVLPGVDKHSVVVPVPPSCLRAYSSYR